MFAQHSTRHVERGIPIFQGIFWAGVGGGFLVLPTVVVPTATNGARRVYAVPSACACTTTVCVGRGSRNVRYRHGSRVAHVGKGSVGLFRFSFIFIIIVIVLSCHRRIRSEDR